MNSSLLKSKIENDPDFINLKRFDFSLKKMCEKYPNGAPDRVISQALGCSETEINQCYQQALAKLKSQITYDYEESS
jgi:hypothetical protein